MLFSEPKIPQSLSTICARSSTRRFSALQRAENSSIQRVRTRVRSPRRFQCSSASRKFLNSRRTRCWRRWTSGFSALQRAENSSILWITDALVEVGRFQCSSASRKFLNGSRYISRRYAYPFQCSSASRKFLNCTISTHPEGFVSSFSALQRAENSSIDIIRPLNYELLVVSVLFSEPKIPQSPNRRPARVFQSRRFSALQRAENSSINEHRCLLTQTRSFSALQRAENSSIEIIHTSRLAFIHVSVLFSEPKIPQSVGSILSRRKSTEFQCSSASRKFLNCSAL